MYSHLTAAAAKEQTIDRIDAAAHFRAVGKRAERTNLAAGSRRTARVRWSRRIRPARVGAQ